MTVQGWSETATSYGRLVGTHYLHGRKTMPRIAVRIESEEDSATMPPANAARARPGKGACCRRESASHTAAKHRTVTGIDHRVSRVNAVFSSAWQFPQR